MPGPNSGNHVVVKDGKFHAIVAELVDGNFIVIKPGDMVFATKSEAISAAISGNIPNGASSEWLHD